MPGFWSQAYTQEQFTNTTSKLSMVALPLGIISVVIFYIFKKQRIFPASLLAWLVLFNIQYSIWLLMKWTADTAVHYQLFNLHKLAQSDPVCKLAIFIDYQHFYVTVTCNFLMVLTLYMTLVRRKDVDYNTNPYYFWSFLAVTFLWPTLIPVIVATSAKVSKLYTCFPDGNLIYLMTVGMLSTVFVETVLLLLTLKSLWNIVTSVRGTAHAPGNRNRREVRIIYMAARFIISYLVQLVCVMPVFIYLLAPKSAHLNTDADMQRSLTTVSQFAAIVDALILLLGNQHFVVWFVRKIYKNGYSSDERRTSSQGTTSVELSTASRSEAAKRSTTESAAVSASADVTVDVSVDANV